MSENKKYWVDASGDLRNDSLDTVPGRVFYLSCMTQVADHLNALTASLSTAKAENEAMRKMLWEASESVCSLQCSSVWKTEDGKQHCELCTRIAAHLKPKPDTGKDEK